MFPNNMFPVFLNSQGRTYHKFDQKKSYQEF